MSARVSDELAFRAAGGSVAARSAGRRTRAGLRTAGAAAREGGKWGFHGLVNSFVAGRFPGVSAVIHAAESPLQRTARKQVELGRKTVPANRDMLISAGLGAARSLVLTAAHKAIPGFVPAFTALRAAQGVLSKLPRAQQELLVRGAGGWEKLNRLANRAQFRLTGSVPAPMTGASRPSNLLTNRGGRTGSYQSRAEAAAESRRSQPRQSARPRRKSKSAQEAEAAEKRSRAAMKDFDDWLNRMNKSASGNVVPFEKRTNLRAYRAAEAAIQPRRSRVGRITRNIVGLPEKGAFRGLSGVGKPQVGR